MSTAVTITAAAVNELRKRTDLPMMDCKSALVESSGDMEKAIQILRERNSKLSVKRAMNETAEGRIHVAIDAATEAAAILDLRCESAPVAKSEQFVLLADDLAKQIVAHSPANVEALIAQPYGDRTVTDRINDVIGLIRENMKPVRFTRLAGGAFGQYIHHDGSVGVLVQVKGKANPDTATLRDVCAHVAAMNPQYMTISQVPVDTVTKEREMAKQQAESKSAGKPPQIIEKIAEGLFKTWAAENVMLEQPIANAAKYDKKTVGQVLAGLGVELVTVVRYKIGEVVL